MQCFCRNPDERASAVELLSHPFLIDTNDPELFKHPSMRAAGGTAAREAGMMTVMHLVCDLYDSLHEYEHVMSHVLLCVGVMFACGRYFDLFPRLDTRIRW